MTRRRMLPLIALLLVPVAAAAQTSGVDTIPGRFDSGKMWTFEYPPAEYFSTTYGFDATPEWFERARLSALRIPGCSASFVSPSGLVVTNHHCARGGVTQVQRAGENLLDDGYFARTLEEERRIPGYWVDQLLAVADVSAEIFAGVDAATTDADRQAARTRAISAVQQRLGREHAGARVDVVPLYNGGRWSAYVFRRFTDVRLVAAAELQLGFFGGDPDNFTYPRHALDFAFLRIYDENGAPFRPTHHFTWGDGAAEGEVVFIIGNPGPTNRLNTVAQLEFLREVQIPSLLSWFDSRLSALRAFYDANPEIGEAMDLRNRMFGLSNSLKAYTGRREALASPEILKRRAIAERAFRNSIAADPELRERYSGLFDEIGAVAAQKTALGPRYGAYAQLGNAAYESALLRRAIATALWVEAQRRGDPADTLAMLRNRITAIGNMPNALERALLTERLHDFQRYLGPDHAVARAGLAGRAPDDAAAALLSASPLSDSVATAQALAAGTLTASDPAVALGDAPLPDYRAFQAAFGPLNLRESELAAELGRARFEVYGTGVPPDATSSPRITDGVVAPYAYNGTIAPAHTTFYGMYDLYHAFGPDSEWALHERWLPPPAGLDLGTPLNFISTADTYGGNSGSPAVTKELAVVGLNFDRNIEGLVRDFLYLPERGRNIMVDTRAIIEALDDVYDLDRIVLELRNGTLYRTEAEADRSR